MTDTPRGQLISDVAVQSVCFSDHHLVTCHLRVPLPPSPVTTSFTYRPLHRINKQAFCRDILQKEKERKWDLYSTYCQYLDH